MDNSLTALSNELVSAVEQIGRNVVSVHGHPRVSSSGIVWKPGVVVTAEHMLRRDSGIRVTLADGRTVAAEVAGRDAETDLAVLKVEGDGDASPQARQVTPGNLVLVIGRTREAGVTAAWGIVSSASGAWHTWRGGQMDQFIRLDLRLYPGASGGAVVNAAGELIGMATAGLSRTSPLAIPMSTIDRLANELLEKGHVARGYLGIGLQPVTLPEHLKTKLNLPDAQGMIVLSVEQDAPAGKAGLVIGDVVTALDGKPVNDTEDVQGVLGTENVGKALRVSIVRGGEVREIPVVVGERPRRRGGCR